LRLDFGGSAGGNCRNRGFGRGEHEDSMTRVATQPTERRFAPTAFLVLLACTALAGEAGAQGSIELVSKSRQGATAEGSSTGPSLDGDGRFVTFHSNAPDLVSGDRNHQRDVFVLDRRSGQIELVSRGFDGAGANGPSPADGSAPSMSRNGRRVAFSSRASNLVPDDRNGTDDVFVYDRDVEITIRISRGIDGEANGASTAPRISADGRFVAFQSFASNLVEDDTNGAADVFLFDLATGAIARVSVGPEGVEANGPSFTPAISGNGRVVAFASGATNLVAGDTNRFGDIFVRDTESGITVRASVDSSGRQSNGTSFLPDLTFDGRTVAFKSDASNLVPGDGNGRTDVFVRVLDAGPTERVSVDSFGNQADGLSGAPEISADGRYVAFPSFASNLDPDDGNRAADLFIFDRTVEREDGTFGVIRRVSVERSDLAEPTGNVSELAPALSADARFVAFASEAANLVPHDINNLSDVFVACNPFDATGCAPIQPCVGDCDGDGRVSIEEVVRMVGIGLELITCRDDAEQACLAGDASCDCRITIDEIIRAVANALNECNDFISECSLEDLKESCLTETPCEIEP
jgi:Tol biopolymer transport system component